MSSALAAPAFIAAPSFAAANEEPVIAPFPAWAERLGQDSPELADPNVAVHMDQLLQAHIGEDTDEVVTALRARILKPEALAIGNLSLPWMPGSHSLNIHHIQIVRDGERIDVLKDHAFTVVNPQTDTEAAVLSGVLLAQLQVPGLEVGDTFEVAYSLKGRDPALGQFGHGFIQAPLQALSGKFRAVLSWDEGQQPDWQVTKDIGDQVRKEANRLIIDIDNPTAAIFPKDAPARYGYSRLIELSSFPDWPTVSREVNALFEKARKLEKGSSLAESSEAIASAQNSDIARAEAALALVQNDIRYVYIGFNGANLTPATADETWRRRFGDCKGKTAILLALLDRLGIEAQPVLVASTGGDGIQDRLPTVAGFDHVLVRAKLNGRWHWLDGTLPADPRARLRPALGYRQVLPLSGEGSDLAAIPPQPLATPTRIEVMNIDASAGYDVPAKVTMRWIMRGVPAITSKAALETMTKAAGEAQLLQSFGSGWLVGDEASWQWLPQEGALDVVVSGSADLDWDTDSDGLREMTLLAAGFYPPDRRMRPAKQDATAPWANSIDNFVCRATTTILPKSADGFFWDHDTGPLMQEIGGVAYWRVGTVRDGSVRTIQSTRTVEAEISPTEAEQANAQIGDFDNSQSSVFETRDAPEDVLHSRSDAITTVPAADEIDWTASAVPCAAPQVPRE